MTRVSHLSLAAACGLAALLAGCDRQSAPDAQPQETQAASASSELAGTIDRASAGDALPDFTLKDIEGKQIALASLKGKPVLLNLWATWCAPCVVEMPMLDDLAADYAGKLQVVTVSQDMKGAEAVAPFFKEKKLAHLGPWLDANSDLSFHFGGGQLPLTVLYDAQGKEVWRIAGGYDWAGEEARAQIEEGIAAKGAL